MPRWCCSNHFGTKPYKIHYNPIHVFVRQAPIPQMQMMPYNVSVACTNLVALPTKSITGRSERLGQLPWNQILRLLKVVDLKVRNWIGVTSSQLSDKPIWSLLALISIEGWWWATPAQDQSTRLIISALYELKQQKELRCPPVLNWLITWNLRGPVWKTSFQGYSIYHLVMTNIAMENHHV
jgi:hypothetical protein